MKGEREKLFSSKSKFSITCEIHSWKELIEWVGCIFKILQKGKSNNKFYQRTKCYTKTSIIRSLVRFDSCDMLSDIEF